MADQYKVIQLIGVNESSGQFELTDEAIDFLMQVPNNVKIAPVTFVGPINSGKSFLLNSITKQVDLFKVAQSTLAETKGIQMWSNLIDTPNPNVKVLLLDTQGLQQPTISLSSMRSPRNSSTGSLRSSNSNAQTYGNTSILQPKLVSERIFQLSALLSSTLVFNLQGPISDRLLEYLEPLARLNDQISGKEGKKHQLICSKFVCLLRDHSNLDLKSVSGFQQQTPDSVLEQTFKQAASLATKKQKLQQQLCSIFTQRKTYCLPKPEQMQDQDFMNQQNGQKDFQSCSEAFFNSLVSETKQGKQILGKCLNANMFLSVTTEFCTLFSSTRPPLSQDYLDIVAKVSSEEAERQQEIAYSSLEDWLYQQPTQMDKNMRQKYNLQLLKHKQQLRTALSEMLSYQEVCLETDQFEDRAKTLIKTYLDSNYNTQFHLSLDILKRLLQQESVLEQKDKFNQLLFDYMKIETECAGDVFAEAVGFNQANKFVDFDSIEPPETVSQLDQQEDSLDQNLPKQERILLEFPQILEIISSQIDLKSSQLQQILKDIEFKQSQAYEEQQRLEQVKSENQNQFQDQAAQLQHIQSQKQDSLLQVEALQREITGMKKQLQDYQELTKKQEQRQHGQQSEQLKDLSTQISKLQDQVYESQRQIGTLEEDLQKEESAFNLEYNKYESEIQLITSDIEVIEQRLQTGNQKSLLFKTTQDFLQTELPDKYITPLKQLLNSDPKEIKKQAFEQQRQTNMERVSAQDKESSQKKKCAQFIQTLKRHNQQILQQEQKLVQEKQKQSQAFLQEKLDVEKKMTDQVMEYVNQKERNFGLVEQLDEQESMCQKSLQQIVSINTDLSLKSDQMMQLEEKSYEMTITNQAKVSIREKLIELLPEIVSACAKHQKKQSMVSFMLGVTYQPQTSEQLNKALLKIDDDFVRQKLAQVLKKYKLI